MANLSYEDCIYIDYAIEYSGFGNDFDQNKIELLFWEKPQDTYEKGTEYYSRKK